MQLGAEMDAGAVFAQEAVDLEGTETKPELTGKLLSLGATTLVEILPGILDGELKPNPQDESKATFCQLLSKGDGEIDWTKPAEILEREIRAFLGWPGSHTKLFDKDVIITAAHVEKDSSAPGEISNSRKELKVFCGQDALVIDTLKPAGKNEMTGAAFLAGTRV
jgi:methionyl-tRNA formyltransferase